MGQVGSSCGTVNNSIFRIGRVVRRWLMGSSLDRGRWWLCGKANDSIVAKGIRRRLW